MQVKKRDGRIIDYDRDRIGMAIKKAFFEVKGEVHPETIGELTSMVEEILEISYSSTDIVDIEFIQDTVENVLMDADHHDVAKAYILYRQKRTDLRQIEPNPTAISDYIHAAKYARWTPKLKRRETFHEAIKRVETMHKKKYPDLAADIGNAFQLVHDKFALPSMRSMQFGGEAIETRNARMYNCSFTLIDRSRVFSEILYLLLCGCGVGYSVQKQHVARLPLLKEIDFNLTLFHDVEDSIEGWADAMNALMKSFLRGYHIEFNFERIRPPGAILNSGGKAPGHTSLKESLEATRQILSAAQGRKLKTIECHDIICHLSKAVLAGGIRRSSLIALFSLEDDDMLYCKDKANFDFQSKNSQRALANNSVVLSRKNCTHSDFMRLQHLNKTNLGDPGFVFLDDFDTGTNPCGEIGIDPVLRMTDDNYSEEVGYWMKEFSGGYWQCKTGFGFCNLVEINAAKCEDPNDFYRACRAAGFIATLQTGYMKFPYLGEVTEKIVERDALIGVSITGIMDAPWIFDGCYLELGAGIVKTTNEETAKRIGINPAKRCTCVKPSGTASLELGCVGSGIHPHHAKKYFRRVIANPLEPVVQYFKQINPQMVDTMPGGDLCITFPVSTNGITIDEISTENFLDKIFQVYRRWILPGHNEGQTHNVSCTLVIDEHDWAKTFDCIWVNRDKISSMTFLPKQSDKEIPFCPREAVTTAKDVAQFESLVRDYNPVDYSKMIENEDVTVKDSACSGATCNIGLDFCSGEGLRIFEGVFDSGIKNFTVHGLTFTLYKQMSGGYIARRIQK
jgi:ribonucleoside-diphosphate reductase alpha chain